MEHSPLQKYMFAIVMELGLNSLKSELDNRREMKRMYEGNPKKFKNRFFNYWYNELVFDNIRLFSKR